MKRLIAVLAGAMAISCGEGVAATIEEPPDDEVWLTSEASKNARLVPLARQKLPQALRAAGRVAFDDLRVSHVFTPVTGRVVKVLAQPGQRLQKGAPLAVIASPDVGSAFSDLLKAQSDLEATQKELERQQRLLAAQAGTQRDLETAEGNFRKASAELERARQRAALLRSGTVNDVTQELTLRSPIAGDLIARAVGPGMEVQGLYSGGSAVELFTVGDTQQVWIYADVAESDLHKVRLGAKASVKVAALPDRTFEGKVEWISETLDPVLRTARIRCLIPNSSGELFPEMYASVSIETEPRQALAIPRESVVPISSQNFAFVAAGKRSDGRMICKRRAIKIADSGVPELAEVLDGLKEGEQLVIEGAATHRDANDEAWVSQAQLQAAGIRLAVAKQQDVEDAVTIGGRLSFDELRVTHVYAPVTGRISKVHAGLGQRVRKGDPLLSLASPDVGSAFSDVVKARADLTAAEHELERQKELFEAHAGARRDLEVAENAFKKAKAEFDRAEQKKLLLRSGAADGVSQEFTLRSPIDGEVVARNVFPGLEVQGQYSGAGQAVELFTIGDIDRLLVLGEVYEMDLPQVRDGAPVTLKLPSAPDKLFRGTAEWVADVLDPQSHTAKVRCIFDNSDHLLKPEMYEMVSVTVPAAHLLALPRTAILRQGAETVIFVRDGTAPDERIGFKRRVVQVDEQRPGGLVPVVGGLHEGETVVVAGGVFLLGML